MWPGHTFRAVPTPGVAASAGSHSRAPGPPGCRIWKASEALWVGNNYSILPYLTTIDHLLMGLACENLCIYKWLHIIVYIYIYIYVRVYVYKLNISTLCTHVYIYMEYPSWKLCVLTWVTHLHNWDAPTNRRHLKQWNIGRSEARSDLRESLTEFFLPQLGDGT